MQLEKLLANLSEFKLSGAKNPEITIVTVDSRQVREGGLFVAVPGFQTDGHKFIDKALAQGAKAIVLEQDRDLPGNVAKIQVPSSRQALADLGAAFYNYPAGQLRLIGVTGTNGKTTTTTLIANILRLNSKVGLIGTTANYIGDRKLPVTHTTPESIELQELLAEMVQAELEFAIMEVSSHALELERVRGLNFEVAVFTNLTQDHLDFHHSMEAYAQANTNLFAGLPVPPHGAVNRPHPVVWH
ncbi:MAG: Mur ligase domain-containing protein [Clostridia bacterium]|nr:Mur ligase domain-containing protein [Clostridia bacterium]